MNIDRAIEILDPTHREQYDGIEEVNEACRMGMDALLTLKEAQENSSAQREMAIYEAAVAKFGEIAQIDQAIEEMAELSVALNKYKRFVKFGHGDKAEVLDNIAQERADVEIMLNQLHVIFGDCSEWACAKLDKLATLVANAGEDGTEAVIPFDGVACQNSVEKQE
jgi:hypothetical protein